MSIHVLLSILRLQRFAEKKIPVIIQIDSFQNPNFYNMNNLRINKYHAEQKKFSIGIVEPHKYSDINLPNGLGILAEGIVFCWGIFRTFTSESSLNSLWGFWLTYQKKKKFSFSLSNNMFHENLNKIYCYGNDYKKNLCFLKYIYWRHCIEEYFLGFIKSVFKWVHCLFIFNVEKKM